MLIPGENEFAGPCYGAPCVYCGYRVRGVVFRKRVATSVIPGMKGRRTISSFYYWHINCGPKAVQS